MMKLPKLLLPLVDKIVCSDLPKFRKHKAIGLLFDGAALNRNQRSAIFEQFGDSTRKDFVNLVIWGDEDEDTSWGPKAFRDDCTITVDTNTEAGIWAAGEGTVITLTGVVVTGTLSSNRYGVGMGVAAYDSGVLDLSGSVTGTAGPGVVAQSGGSVTLHDASVVQDSQFAAVVVWDGAATLRGVTLDGVVAHETADLRLGGGAAVYVDGPTAPSALTLDEVTVTGVLEGVYLLGPGTFLLQNSILTGPNRGYGIVATDGVVPWNGTTGLRILADTVKNWQIGVLLDGSSANVSETTWFGNVFDVVQTRCSDAVPPVEGGGDLGVSALCTDLIWPISTPAWISLE